MHVPSPKTFANHLENLGRTVFRDNRIDGICLLKTLANSSASQYFLSPSNFPCVHDVHASVSLPPSGALPNLFPTVPNGAPKLFPTVFHASTMSTLPSRFLPPDLSPSYFPQFPVRPRCPGFRLAPSQRSFPSYCFLSVHDVHPSVSPPPNGALAKGQRVIWKL